MYLVHDLYASGTAPGGTHHGESVSLLKKSRRHRSPHDVTAGIIILPIYARNQVNDDYGPRHSLDSLPETVKGRRTAPRLGL